MGKVVPKTGKTVRVWGMMFNSVVQLVFLYGSESWVVTGEMLKFLEVFHHRVAIRITGIMAQRMTDREWECPPVAEALETAGL